MEKLCFSEVADRVMNSLPNSYRLQLQSQLSRRIGVDPLRYLTGVNVTAADKFSIFKSSLISIFPKRTEDKEYSLLLHLVRIFLDSMSSATTPVETQSGNLVLAKTVKAGNDCRVPTSTTKTVTKRSALVGVPSSIKAKTLQKCEANKLVEMEVPVEEQPTEVAPQGEPVLNTPSAGEPVEKFPSQKVCDSPITARVASMCEGTSTDNSTSEDESAKSRRRRAKRPGSATPGTTENVLAYKKLALVGHDCMEATIVDEDVWYGLWNNGANTHSVQALSQWLGLPSNHFGLNCRAGMRCIRDCRNCTKTVLLSPLTFCQSVNCKHVAHVAGVGVHHMTDFSLDEAHADQYDMHPDYLKMLKHELSPSLFFIGIHDKKDTKKKAKGFLDKEMDRALTNYLQL